MRIAAIALLFAFAWPLRAVAADDDATRLFAQGVQALHDGRAGEAVSAFEALADRGVIDPVASYDRGLAYATRVRIEAGRPGDLGRAAQGFEEARDLSRDPRLVEDATRALGIVRSELARRRTQAGQAVEVDPGRSLARTLAGLLAEDTWAYLAVLASMALSLGLCGRWLGRGQRLRIGSAIVAGGAVPILLLSIAMTLASRHDRRSLREAIIVSPNARPCNERGVAVPGATPLPEGARVTIVDRHGDEQRVRFGATDGWVPSNALRDLARAD